MDRGSQEIGAFFAYSNSYLIDVKFGMIVDIEASHAIRRAEVGAAKTVIERTEERFGLKPERLAADSACGGGPSGIASAIGSLVWQRRKQPTDSRRIIDYIQSSVSSSVILSRRCQDAEHTLLLHKIRNQRPAINILAKFDARGCICGGHRRVPGHRHFDTGKALPIWHGCWHQRPRKT
jgi:hypothetical protein